MRVTAPRKFIFVLMPFQRNFDDVYALGIKPACESAGAYCERVDEQIFQESILDRIYNQIAKADLIVADMTGRNPNVFYEVGYAHALNKRVILLTSAADDIPFDLKHYAHIVYEGRIADLKEELHRRITWYLSQPDLAIADPASSVDFYINDIKLSSNSEAVLTFDIHNDDQHLIQPLYLLLNNTVYSMLNISAIRVAISCPKYCNLVGTGITWARIPGSNSLFYFSIRNTILPLEWFHRDFSLHINDYRQYVDNQSTLTLPLTLKVFSHSGVEDYPMLLVWILHV